MLGLSIISGFILLFGSIPFINLTSNTSIGGFMSLGQLLGALNFVVAYLVYKKEVR